jgi:hypothetical protein
MEDDKISIAPFQAENRNNLQIKSNAQFTSLLFFFEFLPVQVSIVIVKMKILTSWKKKM